MHQNTRAKVQSYLRQIAELNSVSYEAVSQGQVFSVTPSPEQALREAVAKSHEFLGQVAIVGTDNQSGEVIDLGITTTIAGRTDTSSTGVRAPADPSGLIKDTYTCKQTNYDVALRYALLDQWRHLDNFQALWSAAVAHQMGLDRLMIGFNGTSAAATTNRSSNPLLQDVNIGWLQKMRTANAGRWLTEVVADSDEVRIGTEAGADYRNLDALVYDLRANLHDVFRDDPRLRVMTSNLLQHDKYAGLVNAADTDAPTEKVALSALLRNKTLGGLPVVEVPFFPARALLIGIPGMLQIITQNGTLRRTLVDHAAKDQYEDFNSINEAYGIARLEAFAGAENITYFEEGTWSGD